MSTSSRYLIKRPLQSEKIAKLQGEGRDPKQKGKGDWFAFEVALDANKIDIKHAVEELYSGLKIKVQKVRTLRCRTRTGRAGRQQATGNVVYWKKALVQLAPGQSLNQG